MLPLLISLIVRSVQEYQQGLCGLVECGIPNTVVGATDLGPFDDPEAVLDTLLHRPHASVTKDSMVSIEASAFAARLATRASKASLWVTRTEGPV